MKKVRNHSQTSAGKEFQMQDATVQKASRASLVRLQITTIRGALDDHVIWAETTYILHSPEQVSAESSVETCIPLSTTNHPTNEDAITMTAVSMTTTTSNNIATVIVIAAGNENATNVPSLVHTSVT